MMELQGQMMKSMNEKTKKGTDSFTLGDDEEEDAQEIVRWSGGTLQLPKLEYGQQDNAMECGDWMAKVAITMRDLSKNSHVWWDIIVKDAEEAYQKYMRSSPLVKLEVEAELEEASKYLRLRSKATSILLDAIPKDISAEAVAAREIHPTQLLYAIMKKFQPGGLEERSQLLSRIEEVNACKTCEEAVKELNTWERRITRAQELKLTIPDSSRLMVSLMKIVSTPLQGDHQLAFRVALARSQLEVDLLPTFSTVMQLEKVIKSELQVMTRPEVKQEEVTPKIQTFQPQERPFHGGGKSGKGKGKHEEKKEGDGEKDA